MIYQLVYIIYKASELYSGALIIYALLSWFPGGYESAIGRFLGKICEPYLKIFDRFNLSFGGISFTIMAAILALNLGTRLVGAFLMKLALTF